MIEIPRLAATRVSVDSKRGAAWRCAHPSPPTMSNLRTRGTQRDRKAEFYPGCARIGACTPQFREVCNQPEVPDSISEMLWKKICISHPISVGRKARNGPRDA
jgi:hypothetical protein